MESETDCLVRYGLMGHVGWFAIDAGLGAEFERGRAVVIRTSRGVELGEILIGPGPSPSAGSARPDRVGEDSVGAFRVLRFAEADDLELRRKAEELREERFAVCRNIVAEEAWPLELLDVEPLLDLTTVLHYLAFDDVDLGPVRARFRATCDFDVNFEDLGGGATTTKPVESGGEAGKKRCGDCDCGGGGCSKTKAKASSEESTATTAATACADTPHSGCSSCGVSALMKERRGSSGRSGQ